MAKNKLSKVVAKPIPVKIVNDSPKSTAYADEDKKWRAQSDLRTLKEAAEIKADKARMNAAKCCADKEIKSLKSIK